MYLKIADSVNQRVSSWIHRRIPPCSYKTLSHREIFVLPTRWGVLFSAMILVTLITGINFQNSMVLAVGLFLVSVAIISIISTYRNLAGLSLSFHQSQPCFRGEKAGLEFSVSADASAFYAVEIGWPPDQVGIVDLSAHQQIKVLIECQTTHRGVFRPGRMLITTIYPFGLFRAWSWQDLQAESLVYPKPVTGNPLAGGGSIDQGKVSRDSVLLGQDDFIGLKNHIPGESLSRVAWKKYAQTGEFFSKEFSRPAVDPDWVDFDAFAVADIELKLSNMCDLILDLSSKGGAFGLKMPGLTLPPQHGPLHLQRCLSALALYPDHAKQTF